MEHTLKAPNILPALPPEVRGRNGSVFETIETAAAKLDMAPTALRARCRRAGRRVGDEVVARLGGGIVAFKFGRSWRVRFP